MAAWLYIITNRRDDTLYIGVTTALAARAWQCEAGLLQAHSWMVVPSTTMTIRGGAGEV